MNDERSETTEVIEAPKPRRKRRGPKAGCGKKGYGSVFQNSFIDRGTGKRVKGRWAIAYHDDGKLCREFGYETEEIATEMLERRLKDIAAGTQLPPELRKTKLADLTALVVADYSRNDRKSLRRVTEAIADLHAHFNRGDYPVTELNTNRVKEYVDDRRASTTRYGRPPANGTINRELAMLRRAFNIGIEDEVVRKAPTITLLQEPRGRKGFFEKPRVRPRDR